MSWTLYTRHGDETLISPDPFIFNATLEPFKYFSNLNRTCMLWCITNSSLCAGANILDSDLWELNASHTNSIFGHWRIIAPGRLMLLYSESSPTPINGPSWFLSLTHSPAHQSSALPLLS
jgi:hypothetical protein